MSYAFDINSYDTLFTTVMVTVEMRKTWVTLPIIVLSQSLNLQLMHLIFLELQSVLWEASYLPCSIGFSNYNSCNSRQRCMRSRKPIWRDQRNRFSKTFAGCGTPSMCGRISCTDSTPIGADSVGSHLVPPHIVFTSLRKSLLRTLIHRQQHVVTSFPFERSSELEGGHVKDPFLFSNRSDDVGIWQI